MSETSRLPLEKVARVSWRSSSTPDAFSSTFGTVGAEAVILGASSLVASIFGAFHEGATASILGASIFGPSILGPSSLGPSILGAFNDGAGA